MLKPSTRLNNSIRHTLCKEVLASTNADKRVKDIAFEIVTEFIKDYHERLPEAMKDPKNWNEYTDMSHKFYLQHQPNAVLITHAVQLVSPLPVRLKKIYIKVEGRLAELLVTHYRMVTDIQRNTKAVTSILWHCKTYKDAYNAFPVLASEYIRESGKIEVAPNALLARESLQLLKEDASV